MTLRTINFLSKLLLLFLQALNSKNKKLKNEMDIVELS